MPHNEPSSCESRQKPWGLNSPRAAERRTWAQSPSGQGCGGCVDRVADEGEGGEAMNYESSPPAGYLSGRRAAVVNRANTRGLGLGVCEVPRSELPRPMVSGELANGCEASGPWPLRFFLWDILAHMPSRRPFSPSYPPRRRPDSLWRGNWG